MSYCIAFSIDGATDVTRRYVRNADTQGVDRSRCPEEVLLWITNEIRRIRRETLSKEERRRLIAEDEREDKELRGHVVKALAASFGRAIGNCGSPGGPSNLPGSGPGDEQKLPVRESGSEAWRQARGEDGGQHDPERDARDGP